MKEFAEMIVLRTRTRIRDAINTIGNDEISADGILVLASAIILFFTALVADFTFAIFIPHFLKIAAVVFIVDFVISFFIKTENNTAKNNLCNSISSAIMFLVPSFVVSIVYVLFFLL